MRTMRIGAIVWTLGAFGSLLAPVLAATTASAQAIVEWSSMGPVCAAHDFRSCSSDTTCTLAGTTCRAFEGDLRTCAPTDAAYCAIALDTPCPIDRPHRVRMLDLTFCLSDLYTPCSTPPRACFSRRDLDGPIDWNVGDCDRDGQVNSLDPAPCDTAPVIATVGLDGTCTPSRVLCRDDVDCTGGLRCRPVSPSNLHEYCLPAGDAPFCCGGVASATCPNGHVCSPVSAGTFDLCHPYCEDAIYEERLKCLGFGDLFPVPAPEGDCDGDGLRNQVEIESATNPCIGDDAGVTVFDAGTAVDASVTDANVFDGSATDGAVDLDGASHVDASKMDGSAQPQITFGGGGGCLCGVGSRGHGPMSWGIPLVALMFARGLAKSRRRRFGARKVRQR